MISVIIPLYNKAHTIVNTLNTVLRQTFQDFEIVIVNDGSTDNGVEVITTAFNDVRIKIINQANGGVSGARNTGADAAQYNYLAFLDADDEWKLGYLAKIYEAIKEHPGSGMICCAGLLLQGDVTEYIRIAKKYDGKIAVIDFFENPHVYVHTSATVVTKQVFYEAGGFPAGLKRNEDFAFFFCAALITPVVYCGFPLSVYVGGVEGQTTNQPISLVLEHVVRRFNHVFEYWLKTDKINKLFLVFLRYELRHIFLDFLLKRDYTSLNFFLENLDGKLLSEFPAAEIKAYKNKSLNSLMIKYIYLTKLRWRLRGFPRVGEK